MVDGGHRDWAGESGSSKADEKARAHRYGPTRCAEPTRRDAGGDDQVFRLPAVPLAPVLGDDARRAVATIDPDDRSVIPKAVLALRLDMEACSGLRGLEKGAGHGSAGKEWLEGLSGNGTATGCPIRLCLVLGAGPGER